MAIMEDSSKSIDEYLKVYPFPQPDAGVDRESMHNDWTKIRNKMLDNSGIAIFISGNKIEEGKAVLSKGMLEEFDIAKQKNVIPISIGYTGGASKKISSLISENYKRYYGDDQRLIEMSKKMSSNFMDSDTTVDLIISMICKIQQ